MKYHQEEIISADSELELKLERSNAIFSRRAATTSGKAN
jgi:hypothetical protein